MLYITARLRLGILYIWNAYKTNTERFSERFRVNMLRNAKIKQHHRTSKMFRNVKVENLKNLNYNATLQNNICNVAP